MTTIPSTSAATHTAATNGTADGAVSNPKGTLDKDGFLKLFIAQLQHQDPSKPMDANESVAQMASFSMVEA
jgi:flagellar basal-body rod modification protein FlgD